jgi:hypothetical protein
MMRGVDAKILLRMRRIGCPRLEGKRARRRRRRRRRKKN